MTQFERLMASPAAVNRVAALHTSGGDRTGKEELLWDQNERLHNTDTYLPGRGSARQDNLKRHAQLYDAICKLATLKSGTSYYKECKRHVETLWIAAHGRAGKNYRVRLNDAIARAYKRHETKGQNHGSFPRTLLKAA
jgi:hypothetical protein